MTKFNPENKDVLTYGECLEPIMEIEDLEDAQQYLKDYVAYMQKILNKDPQENGITAEEIVKANIGYWAGYYGDDVRKRVEKLFSCEHPFFGSIKEEGFAINMGERIRKQKK
jgi:hypothetical protein